MYSYTTSHILMTLLVFFILIGFLLLFKVLIKHIISKKRLELGNKAECRKVMSAHRRRLYTDYFWSNHMRFSWIMLFLIFFTALGFSMAHYVSMGIGLFLLVITIYFLIFAYKSYQAFPEKAKKRLTDFETQIEAAVEAEICFDADNIQRFSSIDPKFETKPEFFSFPTNISKIQFPPYETRAPKQPIIATRKLEYLILSREYFSICKNAATFNLLDPQRAPLKKQCAELPGRAGECQEYYYSQIRNVFYDDEDQAIHIIYDHDELEDIKFPCKKIAPNRKPAMKALQGKLRLTERQKLHKIDEHGKYEEILKRREKDSKQQNNEEEEEGKEEE
ncbi:MAG: Unknown protein [uncultured Sulfurovum sp.]|uniref:Uncharacterized protein n=1 Tax=uncultured Sulfurovum sp. TaxID=269237 RepID=A0A6S6SXL5_9BACT|nr:MAG: Unknown protein [uncultured Sulfurovum sp.]